MDKVNVREMNYLLSSLSSLANHFLVEDSLGHLTAGWNTPITAGTH